ncbi:MAG: AzlD domain-containing protein [Actinomycetota bacterium]
MLSLGVVLALAIGVYAQRALGALFLRTENLPDAARRVLDKLPLAIIAAVVALTTVTAGGDLTIDARLAGVAAAGLCAWRKLPMLVAVVAAAVVTALVRATVGG